MGKRLIERSPRAMRLTAEGETFLVFASRMLDLNDEAVARVGEPHLHGVVRIGAPEDFATRHLPGILARFAAAYPLVALEMTCDLTLNLLAKFRLGAFDLVLLKREPSVAARGIRVWKEPLVWVGGARDLTARAGPVPLVVSPEPCVYRKRARGSAAQGRRRKPCRLHLRLAGWFDRGGARRTRRQRAAARHGWTRLARAARRQAAASARYGNRVAWHRAASRADPAAAGAYHSVAGLTRGGGRATRFSVRRRGAPWRRQPSTHRRIARPAVPDRAGSRAGARKCWRRRASGHCGRQSRVRRSFA